MLPAATALLAGACAFDRAGVVAEEKLFGPGPTGTPQAVGAWIGDELAGVAAICTNRIRVLAVMPSRRRQGVGSGLLAACETGARATNQANLRTLDQPGNYLAPGIDERNVETLAWLEKRGYVTSGEPRANVLVDVRGNPKVSEHRARALASSVAERGYEIRRAHADEAALLDAVSTEFGGAWPFELARALEGTPIGVHVALKDGAYCGFAAHDGNNRGLGWFGPTGTWPAHRGQGLGEVLLLACLVDVAVDHAQCEVAWIGPRPFYDKVAGVAADRRFHVLAKTL